MLKSLSEKLLVISEAHHQGEKSWIRHFFQVVKKSFMRIHYEDCNLWLGWVKHTIQDWFGAWGVDIGLPNHVKNWVCNFYPYTLSFLIILLVNCV
jgi:hypothetical protein